MTDKSPSKTLTELMAELKHDAAQAKVRDASGERAVQPGVPQPEAPRPRKGRSL